MHLHSQEVHDAQLSFRPVSSVVNQLTRAELAKYSVAQEIFNKVMDPRQRTFATDITEVAYRARGAPPLDIAHRILIPWQVMQRDLATVPGPKGGLFVGVDVETNVGLVGALKPLSTALSAGATELSNLQNNVALPRVISGVAASWVAEGVADVADNPILGSLSMQPRRIIAVTTVSRQLIVQSPRLMDQFIVRELAAAIAAAFDAAAFGGTGGTQPIGVANTVGVQAVSGAGLTWANVLDMKQKVSDTNARDGSIAFVATPATRELLEGRTKEAGGGTYIWSDDRVAACRALASTNVPSGTLICGDWSRMIVASWSDGLEITVGHANFDAGEIALRAMLACDVTRRSKVQILPPQPNTDGLPLGRPFRLSPARRIPLQARTGLRRA